MKAVSFRGGSLDYRWRPGVHVQAPPDLKLKSDGWKEMRPMSNFGGSLGDSHMGDFAKFFTTGGALAVDAIMIASGFTLAMSADASGAKVLGWVTVLIGAVKGAVDLGVAI